MDENCDELMYREALLKELGDIRGLFKMPDDNDPLDPYWLDAMSDPLSVKAYVEAQLAALEAERDALRKEAERYRWLDDNRSTEVWNHAMSDVEKASAETLSDAIDAAIAAKEPK